MYVKINILFKRWIIKQSVGDNKMSDQEVNKACDECQPEYKAAHQCGKEEGYTGGLCLLACQIPSIEEQERR